jgi:uncharacterized protein YecE (DUF72 family)
VDLFAGTSGYSYKEWKGVFYPDDLPAKDYLRFYAARFEAVEINNTFYRMPKQSVVEQWASEVPEHFTFVLKASQRITHQKRLKDAASEVEYFLSVARALGPKLGPCFFQLPPFQRKDAERLKAFLDILPKDTKVAFEFRHSSWFDEEIYGLLRTSGAALCFADSEDEDEKEEGGPAKVPSISGEIVPTAEFGYLRLRRCDYTAEDLRVWAERMKRQPWKSVYVFFKHEDEGSGPKLAADFQRIFRDPSVQRALAD